MPARLAARMLSAPGAIASMRRHIGREIVSKAVLIPGRRILPKARFYEWRLTPEACGAFVLCIGITVLAGWTLDNVWLTGVWVGDLVPMSPSTALLFTLFGASLAASPPQGSKGRWLTISGAATVAFASATRLADSLLNVNSNVDRLFFDNAISRHVPLPLVGMAPTTAIGFLGAGAALALLVGRNSARWRLGQFLLTPAILLALFAFVGHLYQALAFYQLGSHFQMSFATATCFMVLSCGILRLHPSLGFIGVLSTTNLGGATARRLFPVALLVPPLLGLIAFWLTRASLVDEAGGLAALVTMTGPIFAIAILVASRRLESTAVELEAARKAAEQANRVKSVFLASMSHELRTPLNAIIGFSEILRDLRFGATSEHYAEYAGDIFDSGYHLLGIVNQLLDLAKLEALELDLVDDLISLPAMIQTCVGLVGEQAVKKGIVLSSDVPPDFPQIIADEIRLKQIFLNLLSNAVKFNVSAGKVVFSAQLDESGGAEIRLRDTGIGMNMDELKTAFIPFRQVDSGLARQFEGAGLGLPLAKALTERHGGSLELDSVSGVGTTAIIRLPASRVAQKTDDARSAQKIA